MRLLLHNLPRLPKWSVFLRLFRDSGVSRAGYDGPPPLCLWLVAALMRGDRNEKWPLQLRGWSCPLPRRCWRLTRACRSEVPPPPFFTSAGISQTVIAPMGRPRPKGGEGEGRSHWSSDALPPVFHRSSGASFSCYAEGRASVCLGNGLVFLFEEKGSHVVPWSGVCLH